MINEILKQKIYKVKKHKTNVLDKKRIQQYIRYYNHKRIKTKLAA